MPDRVGQQIGNYRLVKLLGKGGFAEVYLGQHVHLASKQAAIKILHLLDVDARKFQEEAETTEKLVHSHIVRLLDFALEEGTPFLVLDYAPGGSLRTRHPRGSIVPLTRVGAYLKDIAPALQYAHDQHILHRDIKPDNVLIGRQGDLLVSDFGIAVLTQTGRTSLSSAYDIGGTPYYMAPETYQGRPGKESDQYALAVVVYEWLCGSVPFTEGNFIQLGYQHAYNPVPPLREKNPNIPPRVEAVVLKALAKEPKDRFGSVQAFVQALEQASIPTLPAEKPQSGRGIPDKQMPPDQSSQQWRGHSSQPSVVQTPQSVQDNTGVLGKAAPRSVPPGVTPVGKTEPPLKTPVVMPPSQSVVSMEKATSPNQALPPTVPAMTPPPSPVETRPIQLIKTQEVLDNIQRRNIPPTWQVFHPRPVRYFNRSGLWVGILCILFLAGVLTSYTYPSLLYVALIVVALISAATIWVSYKRCLLVLMPGGFIQRSGLWKLDTINYAEVANISTPRRGLGWLWGKGTLFIEKANAPWWHRSKQFQVHPTYEAPEEIALKIISTYQEFIKIP